MLGWKLLKAGSTYVALMLALTFHALTYAIPIDTTEGINKEIASTKVPLLQDAYRLLTARQFDAAAQAFDRILELEPTSVEAMLGRAATAQGLGQRDVALEWARKAVRAAPEDLRALYGEARLMLDLGDVEAARSRLQRISAKFPQDVPTKLALAASFSAANRDSEAGSVLEEAAQLAPKDVSVLHALGLNYLKRNRADSAVRLYEQLLAMRPDFGPGWIGHGDALALMQRNEQALAAYHKADLALPRHALPVLKKAVALERLQRYDEAQQAYLEAIKRDPKSAIAYNNVAYLSAQRGKNLAQARQWAEQAIALNGKVAAFHDTLGWVHWMLGERDMAISAFKRALALDPAHAGARRHLAQVQASKSPPKPNIATQAPSAAAAAAPVTPAVKAVVAPPLVKPSAPVTADSSEPRTQTQQTDSAKQPNIALQTNAPASGADAAALVRARLDSWREAWQSKDVERYLGFYARSFAPSGSTRAQWEADRRKKLAKKGPIRIELVAVVVEKEGTTVRTSFKQRYASENYRDETEKTLTWIEEEGQWRVRSETQTTPAR